MRFRIWRDRSGKALVRSLGMSSLLAALASFLAGCSSAETARFGDLTLENGQVLRDAQVTYRTRGTLNPARSNAVLVLPWFQGTSVQTATQVGPGKLVDTSKFFVVLADSFGNGLATSPSNSTAQPGAAFPHFTMGDIVVAHHRLVAETLRLPRLHAVVGISMGGMLAFEWAVRYPDAVGKVVSIVGSPQTQPDDIERWSGAAAWLRQPAWARTRSRLERFEPRGAWSEYRTRPEDQFRQMGAIARHDIFRGFDGSMEKAAAALRPELLVVGTWEDREVNPKPGFDFARVSGAQVVELNGRCGHQAPSCERATMWPAVSRFLDAPRVERRAPGPSPGRGGHQNR